MMATEATSENFADPPTIAEPEPNTTTSTSYDVTSDALQVNGEASQDDSKPDSDAIEYVFNSAEVSINGGSDTETSKAEPSKSHVDEKGQIRNISAVKKPTTFKAVSVNKTFLAAKGAPNSAPAKPGDKASTGSVSAPAAALTSAASRPRLVAKLGSGLRDTTPRTTATTNGGKASGAPDANVVWNKNRPAPPPEQKRITDEELKLQYGIHLATRLQSDDSGKQANWADIDDDDEDWAPETIEWTDGTKITLSQQTEEVMPAIPDPIPPVSEVINVEGTKPASPVPSISSSTVRLGGISGVSGKGLILKGAAEKPTLVAKPPGPPTPVKSPWASLPPVDKVAPITMELPQQQAPRFAQRDPHGFDAMPPPPAKEIAADDFSRSWREGNTNTSRELYNSQSGRYEPVNDSRRGPVRGENPSRLPAVLQRPSHNEQQGPAEPSAAFQTSRATGQDGRRRASSNVSGGSGNFGRRMSKGQEMHPPQELLNARRGSLVAVSDSPSSPRMQSPSGQLGSQRQLPPQQLQSKGSPSASHASPASIHGQMAQSPHTPTPVIPIEDEVELQKKIMRESRELARKRRLEEEAREDAERKERIRLKLEAMGPAPEKKLKKDNAKDGQVVPTHIQSRDSVSTNNSPPKPPVPEVAGEIQQYGLMKVHHPEPLTSHSSEFQLSEDFHPNGSNTTTGNRHEVLESAPLQPLSQDPRPSQPWQSSSSGASGRFPSWASPIPHATQSRNVWGSPTADSLGNGTFNPDLSRIPDIPSVQIASNTPGPIGPPNQNRGNVPYQNRSRDPHTPRPAPIAPPRVQQGLSQQEIQQRANANAAWNSLPEKLALEDAVAREEQDKRDAGRRELVTGNDVQQPVFKETWRQVTLGSDGVRSAVKSVSQTVNDGSTESAWKDFPTQLSQDEAAERVKMDQREASRRLIEANGAKIEVSQPYKDTWRQVPLENGVRSEILGSAAPINNGAPTSSSTVVRGSRFFPQSKNVRFDEMNASLTRPGSPSPPPPTMAGHPAYDGDSLHPHVQFPRPPPVVRLPPAPVLAPIGPPKSIASFAAAAAAAAPEAPVAPPSQTTNYQQKHHDIRFANEPTSGSRPAQGQAVWQDRINSLIGRKSSPPKSHAFAVDSASKNALELPSNYSSATVSLPNIIADLSSDNDSSFETKPMAEQCFEEQEMGSLPAIRVPTKAPEAAWHMVQPQFKPLPRKFLVSHPTSSEALIFAPQVANNFDTFHIFLPGMVEEKLITAPHKMEPRQKSNSRRGAQSRGGVIRHASAGHPRGARPRDSSSGLPSPTLDHASTSSTPSSSSRGGGRSRGGLGSNWANNRHVSTPASAINV